MAQERFLLVAIVLLSLFDEESGGARHGGGGEVSGDGEMGPPPPKLLFINGFAALICAVGLACWPLREAAGGVEPWIEGFFYLELFLLLLLGLGQLFLYVAMATGVAARRGLCRLSVTLPRATGVLVLFAISVAIRLRRSEIGTF